MVLLGNSLKGQVIGWAVALTAAIILQGCATGGKNTTTVVTDIAPSNSGKPKISGLVDLGGLDIVVGDRLPESRSDKRFSPGEWVLLQGSNLGVTKVDIDGAAVPVTKYYRGQPLFQIPVGLSPRKEHQIQLTHSGGKANHTFLSSHYIVVTDTDDKTIHLVRTNSTAEGGIESDWLKLDANFSRPLFNLISADSRFMFCINIKGRPNNAALKHQRSYILEVATFHLAAPEKPELLASMDVEIESALTDAVIGDNNQLMLLGRQSLIVLDVSNPQKPLSRGRMILPNNPKKLEHTYYGDAVFLNGGTQVAALEVQNNTVTLIDVSVNNKFTLLDNLAVLPEKAIPFSVDLEADPQSPGSFWILQAPNYRLIDSQLFGNLYDRYIQREDTPFERKAVYQLQKVQARLGKLTLDKVLRLPEGYAAYYAAFGRDGRIYVTATKMNFFSSGFFVGDTKNIFDSAKRILRDNVSLGRVIAVNTQSGAIDNVAGGVGIYYHLVDVPDIGPVFSLLKFGPSLSYPFIVPSWGLGIKSTGTYTKRKMNYRALFPPYSVGYVGYQY